MQTEIATLSVHRTILTITECD